MGTQQSKKVEETSHDELLPPADTGLRPMLAASDPAGMAAGPPDRPKRPSARPSAFGLPFVGTRAKAAAGGAESRTGSRDAASSERELTPGSEAEAEARAAGTSGIKRITAPNERSSAPKAETAPAAPLKPVAIKTDIEQLLPISQAVKSLPRPPRLTGDSQPPPAPTQRRFPWASLTVFALVLTASSVPLFHYSDMRLPQPEANNPRARPAAPPARLQRQAHALSPAHAAVARLERELSGQPARLPEALLTEGEQALATSDGRLAEAFFARAYELAPSDARAEVGLARVRLMQADLEGAEGWLLSALAKEPQMAEYRLLYAEVLERQGRPVEAKSERATARSIANFARSTPSR